VHPIRERLGSAFGWLVAALPPQLSHLVSELPAEALGQGAVLPHRPASSTKPCAILSQTEQSSYRKKSLCALCLCGACQQSRQILHGAQFQLDKAKFMAYIGQSPAIAVSAPKHSHRGGSAVHTRLPVPPAPLHLGSTPCLSPTTPAADNGFTAGSPSGLCKSDFALAVVVTHSPPLAPLPSPCKRTALRVVAHRRDV